MVSNMDVRTERLKLLAEIDKLQQGCNGCEAHYQFNRERNITALTNACKQCSLGRRISEYGEKLLDLTRKSRRKKINKC
jgi:lipocalin